MMTHSTGTQETLDTGSGWRRSTRARKPISADRRIQNRVAQKAYRDRKKNRIRELEQRVASLQNPSQSNASPYVSPAVGDSESGQRNRPIPNESPDLVLASVDDGADDPSWHDLSLWLNTPEVDFDFIGSHTSLQETPMLDSDNIDSWASLSGGTDDMPNAQTPISRSRSMHADAQSSIRIYRPGGTMLHAKPRSVREYYQSLPQSTRNSLRSLAKSGDYSFVDIVLSVLELTSLSTYTPLQLETPSSATQQVLDTEPYSPYRNFLRIARFSYFAAFFANLSSLGFDFSLFLDENSVSPFYNQKRPDVDNDDIPIHLRPIASQFKVSHHPYIDSLPFPTFRNRVLAALAADPPLLDEDDLCIDLMLNDGLVCWGSTNGGVDHGTPWDSQSWEAKEWFLKKWWWLVGGQDGELYQSSRWWALQRGERISMKITVDEVP